MESPDRLITFTKKGSFGIKELITRPYLACYPFRAVTSRLNYRTEVFHFEKKAEPIQEVLASRLKPLAWEECCALQAQRILALKKERYYLAFSGGIDSTAMIVSFLKNWPEKDLKKITILLTHHSVEENPTFFDKYVSKFALENYLVNLGDLLKQSDSMILMAELGDQLFGSDLFLSSKGPIDRQIKRYYKDAVPEILDHHTQTPGIGKLIFEHFHPIVEECPFPIRTTHDFFWWLNFTQKWQHVKYRYLQNTSWNMNDLYGERILNFYDSIEFQKWSLENHDLKIRDTWSSYKFSVKDYIYNFTKDKAQQNLVKIQSLEKTYFLTPAPIAINKDYQIVSSLEELKKYVRADI